MKLHIFGSLAGMNPRPGRCHTALALEKDGFLHWFDAGESSSRTAFFMGLNTKDIRSMYLSHWHIDHWGGLANVLGSIRRHWDEPTVEFPLFLPEKGVIDPFLSLIWTENPGSRPKAGEPEKAIHWEDREDGSARTLICPLLIHEGLLREKDGIRVEARPTAHLVPEPDGIPRSWCFRIQAEGKTVLFSGDMKSIDEFGDWLNGPVDMLLMETGHHSAPELCRKLKHEKRKIGKLVFLHHGFEIIDHYDETWNKARDIWEGELFFAEDAQSFEL